MGPGPCGQNGQPGTDGDTPASLENAGGIGALLAVDDTLRTAGASDDVQPGKAGDAATIGW